MMDFVEFQKIARLSRECVVTEKIDGTNASVYINSADATFLVGSRTRWITPEQDNHGFARWAFEHRDELLTLGDGHHFGEWWGSGIQRGYGLPKGEKRFSLFNVARWHRAGGEPFLSVSVDPRIAPKSSAEAPSCCSVVPILYRGSFDSFMGHCEDIIGNLRESGSWAAPGFMQPEGIVVFHAAGGHLYKKTLEKDEAPKSLAK
jgi:hypothetical protein